MSEHVSVSSSSMSDVDSTSDLGVPPPARNTDMEEKHQILQQMDENYEKKISQADTLFKNILSSVDKTKYSTLRALHKAGIEKLLYFVKDSKEGLDRTVLTMLWTHITKMVQDFNACVKEERRYDLNKRRSEEDLNGDEKEEEEEEENTQLNYQVEEVETLVNPPPLERQDTDTDMKIILRNNILS